MRAATVITNILRRHGRTKARWLAAALTAGQADADIAARMGVSRTCVVAWRQALGCELREYQVYPEVQRMMEGAADVDEDDVRSPDPGFSRESFDA